MVFGGALVGAVWTLNESPSEKEGKSAHFLIHGAGKFALNESPSEKEGKFRLIWQMMAHISPSMKVPPKRKGNAECR